MLRSASGKYYRCQVLGWGGTWVLLALSQWLSAHWMSALYLWFDFRFILSGFISTHLLRTAMVRFRWKQRPLGQVLPRILFAIVSTSINRRIYHGSDQDFVPSAVDEDPDRCRKELTDFSQLLRRGYLKQNEIQKTAIYY